MNIFEIVSFTTYLNTEREAQAITRELRRKHDQTAWYCKKTMTGKWELRIYPEARIDTQTREIMEPHRINKGLWKLIGVNKRIRAINWEREEGN